MIPTWFLIVTVLTSFVLGMATAYMIQMLYFTLMFRRKK